MVPGGSGPTFFCSVCLLLACLRQAFRVTSCLCFVCLGRSRFMGMCLPSPGLGLGLSLGEGWVDTSPGPGVIWVPCQCWAGGLGPCGDVVVFCRVRAICAFYEQLLTAVSIQGATMFFSSCVGLLVVCALCVSYLLHVVSITTIKVFIFYVYAFLEQMLTLVSFLGLLPSCSAGSLASWAFLFSGDLPTCALWHLYFCIKRKALWTQSLILQTQQPCLTMK